MSNQNPNVKLTKTGTMQPIAIHTTWLQFTQWIDALYSKHGQNHGLDFEVSLNTLNSNKYLQFPTVVVEIIK